MIQLLFALLSAEAAVVVLLLVKTPLRKLVVLAIDRLKRGRGPVMVRTVAATILVVFVSSVYSMLEVQNRSTEAGGALTPTDQVLWSRHLLESSLMGYSLFLSLIIDRMHHYIKELRRMRKATEAVVKQNRVLEEGKSGGSEEIKARDREIASLKAKVAELESETKTRLKEVKAAEANVEDKESLRNQLQSIDHNSSHSDTKKIS